MSESAIDTLRSKLQEAGPVEVKNKVGRPVGSGKKVATMRNWQPKEFTAEYEAICIGACRGISNKDLAKIFGKSEVQIGNILNCVKAVEFREVIRKNLPRKEVEDSYKYILDKATERLKAFVDDDETFKKFPISAVDRAMKSMEMIDARLRANESHKTTNNTLVLASEANVNRLLRGLEKSRESDKLHDNSINDGAAENLRNVRTTSAA